MTELAEINVINNDNITTIIGNGILDLTNSETFHDELKKISLNEDNVIVDLRDVCFIDSAVIQDIANAAIAMGRRGKRLKVIVMKTAYPLRVLQITGLDKLLDIDVIQADSK